MAEDVVKAKHYVERPVWYIAIESFVIYYMLTSAFLEPSLHTCIANQIATDGRSVVQLDLNIGKQTHISMVIVETL